MSAETVTTQPKYKITALYDRGEFSSLEKKDGIAKPAIAQVAGLITSEISKPRINRRPLKYSKTEAITTQLTGGIGNAFLSLPQEQAWEIATEYWDYIQTHPDERMDIPEYYARTHLAQAELTQNTPAALLIERSRIIDSEARISQKERLEIEKRLLRAFVSGTIGFEDLIPLEFQIGRAKDMLNLWREGDQKVYLVLSKHFEIQNGDKLELLPEHDTPEAATFLLARDGKNLARYAFIKDQAKFSIQDNIAFNGNLAFRYIGEEDVYIDDQNQSRLVTQDHLINTFNISHHLAKQLLEGLKPTLYINARMSDRPISLYSEESVLAIAEKRGIHKIDGWEEREYGFLEPGMSILTYRDSEGDWIFKSNILSVVEGMGTDFLAKILPQVRVKQVRAISGKTYPGYNLKDFLSLTEFQERLKLGRANRQTSNTPVSEASWITIDDAVKRYQGRISRGTLEDRFLTQVSRRWAIMSRRGRPPIVINFDELKELEELRSYIAKPQVDLTTGIYHDEETHRRCATLAYMHQETGLSYDKLKRIINETNITALPGRDRTGKEVPLFDIEEVSQAVQRDLIRGGI